MAQNAGRVTETKTSAKTTGNNNAPGQVTKQPGKGQAYDNTVAPYNHDSNDVTGFVGVDPCYRTYAGTSAKPLPVGQTTFNLSDESEGDSGDGNELSGTNGEAEAESVDATKKAPVKRAPAKA